MARKALRARREASKMAGKQFTRWVGFVRYPEVWHQSGKQRVNGSIAHLHLKHRRDPRHHRSRRQALDKQRPYHSAWGRIAFRSKPAEGISQQPGALSGNGAARPRALDNPVPFAPRIHGRLSHGGQWPRDGETTNGQDAALDAESSPYAASTSIVLDFCVDRDSLTDISHRKWTRPWMC